MNESVDSGEESLASPCELWAEYALHVAENAKNKTRKPFLSSKFAQQVKTLLDVVGVMCLLDLPEELPEHGFKSLEGRKAELKAADNLVLFQKEIKESKKELKKTIQVSQKYLDVANNYEELPFDEFLFNHPYAAEVIFTNISAARLDLEVLAQIPEGALPLGDSAYQKSHYKTVNSYGSCNFRYHFYFPAPGKFLHFPANVAIDGVIVAATQPAALNVVLARTKLSEESFKDVVSMGNPKLVLNFLRDHPIERIAGFNWGQLNWFLLERQFYGEMLKLLREQRRFESQVWRFSLYHKDDALTLHEYFDSLSQIKERLGPWFESDLITIRAPELGHQHLEYYPLINSRTHNVCEGLGTFAIHPQLADTYAKLIFSLATKVHLDMVDKMTLVYYLVLQERVKEALNIFAQIQSGRDIPDVGTLRLQYDYMAAYLDFFVGAPDFKVARQIVPKYLQYPFSRWRLLFLDIQVQLQEYDKKKADPRAETVKPEEKAIVKEPQLLATLVGNEIVLDYLNLSSIDIQYFLVDMESLFSRAPFLTDESTECFSYIFPNLPLFPS